MKRRQALLLASILAGCSTSSAQQDPVTSPPKAPIEEHANGPAEEASPSTREDEPSSASSSQPGTPTATWTGRLRASRTWRLTWRDEFEGPQPGEDPACYTRPPQCITHDWFAPKNCATTSPATGRTRQGISRPPGRCGSASARSPGASTSPRSASPEALFVAACSCGVRKSEELRSPARDGGNGRSSLSRC